MVLACQTVIPFDCIQKIEKSKKSLSNDKSNVCLSMFDIIDPHNVTIYLKEERTLNKIYGIEKKYRSISLYLDESEMFTNKIEQIIKA